MATWVSFTKVQNVPAVLNKYRGTGEFYRAVQAEANGAKSWARRHPQATRPLSDACWQVDVEAIPLLQPITVTGAYKY